MPFPLPDFAQDLLMPLLHEAKTQGLALICMQQMFADQDADIYFMQDGHYQQHGNIPAAQYQAMLQALQRSTTPGQTESAVEFQLNKTLLPEWRLHLRVNGILMPTQQGGTVLTLEFADVGIALLLQKLSVG